MNEPFRFRGSFWEGTRFEVRARIPGPTGAFLVPSEVTGWTLNVYDQSAGTAAHTPVYTETGTNPSTLLTYSLQPWAGRTKGSNFSDIKGEGDWTTKGGHLYVLDYALELAADGGPVILLYEMACVTRGSGG